MKKIYVELLVLSIFALAQISNSKPVSAEPRHNPDNIKIDPEHDKIEDKTTARKSRQVPNFLAEITNATSNLFEAYNNDLLQGNNKNGNIHINSKDNSAQLQAVVNKFVNTVEKTLSLLSSAEQNINSQQNIFNSGHAFAISVIDLPTATTGQKVFKEQENNLNSSNLQSRFNQLEVIFDPPVHGPGFFVIKEATTDFKSNNGFNEETNINLESKFGSNNQEDIFSNDRLPKENILNFEVNNNKSKLDAAGNQKDVLYLAQLSVPHKSSSDFKKQNNVLQLHQDVSSFGSSSNSEPFLTVNFKDDFKQIPSMSLVDNLPNQGIVSRFQESSSNPQPFSPVSFSESFKDILGMSSVLGNMPNIQNMNFEENTQQIPLTSSASMFQAIRDLQNGNIPVIFPKNNPSFIPDMQPIDITSSRFDASIPNFSISNFDVPLQTSTASSFMTQTFNQNFPKNDISSNQVIGINDNFKSPTGKSLNFNSQVSSQGINNLDFVAPIVGFESFNQFDIPGTNNFENGNSNTNFNSLMEIPLDEHVFDLLSKRLPLELTDSYGDKVTKFKRQNKNL